MVERTHRAILLCINQLVCALLVICEKKLDQKLGNGYNNGRDRQIQAVKPKRHPKEGRESESAQVL